MGIYFLRQEKGIDFRHLSLKAKVKEFLNSLRKIRFAVFRTTELLGVRQVLGKFITTVTDVKMKGQINFHILIKRLNGFL